MGLIPRRCRSRLIVLLVAVCTSTACADSPTTNDNLVFLEEVTGSDLCSSGGVLDGNESLELASLSRISANGKSFSTYLDTEKYRSIAVARFDTKEYRCLSFDDKSLPFPWRGFGRTDLVRNSGHMTIDGRLVPVIVSRAREFEYRAFAGRRTIYIRVPGGPGQSDLISPTDALIDYFRDTLVIDFFYTGNGFNTIHPEPAFAVAAEQLASFLEELRQRNSDANIVLIGVSLGAVLSVSALSTSEPSDIELDSLVLLSPPFASLAEVGPKLRALPGASDMTKRSLLYRVRSTGSNYNRQGKEIMLDWTDVFESFFTPDQGDKRLAERLRQVGGDQPTLIVYGDADSRIGPELAADFLDDPISNVQLLRIEGMKHSFNPQNDRLIIRDAIANLVDSAL